MATDLERYLLSNRDYQAGFSLAELRPEPGHGLAVVTCMDTRIDPLSVLGIEPGDANVLRNAGGRVTDDVLRSLGLATRLLGVTCVVVVHHTSCALAGRKEEELARALASRGLSQAGSVSWLAMDDADAALADDVERARSSPLLAPGTLIEGWRYDVTDGSLRRVVSS